MRNARFSYSRYYIYAQNWYMSVTLIPSKKSLQTLLDYFYLFLCRSGKRLKESKGKYSSRFQNRTSKILPLMKQRSQIFLLCIKRPLKVVTRPYRKWKRSEHLYKHKQFHYIIPSLVAYVVFPVVIVKEKGDQMFG